MAFWIPLPDCRPHLPGWGQNAGAAPRSIPHTGHPRKRDEGNGFERGPAHLTDNGSHNARSHSPQSFGLGITAPGGKKLSSNLGNDVRNLESTVNTILSNQKYLQGRHREHDACFNEVSGRLNGRLNQIRKDFENKTEELDKRLEHGLEDINIVLRGLERRTKNGLEELEREVDRIKVGSFAPYKPDDSLAQRVMLLECDTERLSRSVERSGTVSEQEGNQSLEAEQ